MDRYNRYNEGIKTIVERDPKKLKFDPNQPRKKFSEESIENIANTYDAQEIINEPEIDENDMIITGELRVRGAIKKGLPKIKCKVLSGLSPEEKFERQVIENLHHNLLEDEDKENAIRKLWDSGRYTTETELANAIGMNNIYLHTFLKLKDQKKILGINKISNISIITLTRIQSLSIEEQKKIIQKIDAKQLKQGRELRELVVEIKKLPEDLKEAVLTTKNPIDLEMAKTIAQFPKEEQRTEMIAEVISIDKMKQDSLQYHLDIAQGKIPEKKILEDPMKLRMKRLLDIKFKIFNNFSNEYLSIIDIQEYRQEAYKIMREIYNFLRQELERVNELSIRKVIEVKER